MEAGTRATSSQVSGGGPSGTHSGAGRGAGAVSEAGEHRRLIPLWVRARLLEVVGWLLLVLGAAALVLPGPGLLMLAAGLALLGLRYAWARRMMEPVKLKAIRGAVHGVRTPPRIALSGLGGLALIAWGITWGLWRDVPSWWPLDDAWWLPGGWATAVTLMLSGLLALGLLSYSVHRVHGSPRPGR
ncbi:MAG: PGPGW domain-containing protein [Nesterenkonia sp.]|nr:PGPGW domain-containing protein [Nesterenkonia sp.]